MSLLYHVTSCLQTVAACLARLSGKVCLLKKSPSKPVREITWPDTLAMLPVGFEPSASQHPPFSTWACYHSAIMCIFDHSFRKVNIDRDYT